MAASDSFAWIETTKIDLQFWNFEKKKKKKPKKERKKKGMGVGEEEPKKKKRKKKKKKMNRNHKKKEVGYRGLTGGFLLLRIFSVAISVRPHVCLN